MTELSFLEVVQTRRSVRTFLKKPVSLELVKEILSLETYAPTNCNQQLWNFMVITDEKIKQQLITEAASSTIIARAPVVIAVMYDGWNYKEAIQGGAIAVQNILLAATYYGLGCLSMNSYGNDEKIKNLLSIPKNQQLCCFVLLGYADPEALKVSPVPRRPVHEVMHVNKFNTQVIQGKPYDPEAWTTNELVSWQQYYCRKTFLGKEMDIMHALEKDLVGKQLAGIQKPVLDLLSYDGCYIKEFPPVPITSADLCAETQAYTCAAVKLYCPEKQGTHTTVLLDLEKAKIDLTQKFETITCMYKFERISKKQQEKLLVICKKQLAPKGELVIISRTNNILFTLFYWFIKTLFGDDIRKTGIYAFFGPYKPLNLRNARTLLKKQGFTVKQERYFTVPAFFDQALQMYLQFKKSGGSSYLHRIRRENWMTRLVSKIILAQGLKKKWFGSVVVLRAKK